MSGSSYRHCVYRSSTAKNARELWTACPRSLDSGVALQALALVTMELIAQIALGVIIGGLTIALLVMGFFVWNGRQRSERLALGLFIAGAVIVAVLVVVVASY